MHNYFCMHESKQDWHHHPDFHPHAFYTIMCIVNLDELQYLDIFFILSIYLVCYCICVPILHATVAPFPPFALAYNLVYLIHI